MKPPAPNATSKEVSSVQKSPRAETSSDKRDAGDKDKTDPPPPGSEDDNAPEVSLDDLGERIFDELEHTNPWLTPAGDTSASEVAALLDDMPKKEKKKRE